MIAIKEVCKNFDSHKVLNNVNLNIEKGQTTVIIGRSGCGKSVLLKHIVGILRPDSGKIFIDRQDISSLNEKQMKALT
jgi:phospholipid/cholesterol/gamma-HCH transport system ATP-binding protein